MFHGGSSLLGGVRIVSACPKVLNDFKADVFKVDSFIVIASIPFPTYQVLAFVVMERSTKFKYLFNFISAFCYFPRLFVVTTWELRGIILDARFDLADVEGIMDMKKSIVHLQLECVVVPLLVDLFDPKRSNKSRLEFLICIQEVDVLRREKNLLPG